MPKDGKFRTGLESWELWLSLAEERVTRADRREVPSLSELSVCSRSVEKSESSVPSELLPAFLFLRGIAGGCSPTVPIRAAAAPAGTGAPAGSVAASVAVPNPADDPKCLRILRFNYMYKYFVCMYICAQHGYVVLIEVKIEHWSLD